MIRIPFASFEAMHNELQVEIQRGIEEVVKVIGLSEENMLKNLKKHSPNTAEQSIVWGAETG